MFADLPKTNLLGVLLTPALPPGGVKLRKAPLLPPIDGGSGGAAVVVAAGGAPNGEKDDGAVAALPKMDVEEVAVVIPPPPKNDGFGGESSGGVPPNVNGGMTRVGWSPDVVSSSFVGSAFAVSSTSSLPVPRGFENRSLRASALAISEFSTAATVEEVDDDSLGLLLLSSCSAICFSDSIFLANAAAFRFFNLY
jgi:hypothetical protein